MEVVLLDGDLTFMKTFSDDRAQNDFKPLVFGQVYQRRTSVHFVCKLVFLLIGPNKQIRNTVSVHVLQSFIKLKSSKIFLPILYSWAAAYTRGCLNAVLTVR